MNKILRQELKKIYKEKKYEDSKLIGGMINGCIQILHQQDQLIAAKEDPDVKLAENTVAELRVLREERRFTKDFPSFASFKNFVIKNNVKLEDLREPPKETV